MGLHLTAVGCRRIGVSERTPAPHKTGICGVSREWRRSISCLGIRFIHQTTDKFTYSSTCMFVCDGDDDEKRTAKSITNSIQTQPMYFFSNSCSISTPLFSTLLSVNNSSKKQPLHNPSFPSNNSDNHL